MPSTSWKGGTECARCLPVSKPPFSGCFDERRSAGQHPFPEEAQTHPPFRLYTVLTDSMAPEISPMSLVPGRQIFPDAPLELKPEQTIPFRAERFGKQIIQTHHFFPHRMGCKTGPCHLSHPSAEYPGPGFLPDHPGEYSGRVCSVRSLSGQDPAVSEKSPWEADGTAFSTTHTRHQRKKESARSE